VELGTAQHHTDWALSETGCGEGTIANHTTGKEGGQQVEWMDGRISMNTDDSRKYFLRNNTRHSM
jgi:hypothetical protein